ncbi:hypothetical protein N9D22_05280 [Flavobacteriaceae bacterium]|nr:hypothetical protein [Flavobacteriaceae bacterium]
MSNIVAIDNFTVTSEEFVIPGGGLISSVAPQAVLTITPNQGYEIEASNFTVVSSNPEVDVPGSYFTQDGENVILTVVFITTATMPNNNLDIKICMRGAAQELGVTIAGTVFYDTANAIPLPQSSPYTNSGPAESTEEILSQLIQADTGYYFQATPTISLRTGDPTDYNLYTTGSVLDSNNRLTAIRVNADYTYPFVNHSGDEIDVYAHAIEIPVILEYVTGYSINTTVPAAQTVRDLAITGVQGADYSLTIDNGATFSNGTNAITGVLPAGQELVPITFPAVTSTQTHNLTFVVPGTDLSPDFNQPNPIVFTRRVITSIQLSGTITSGDADISVTNPTPLPLDASYNFTQSGSLEHDITISPVGGFTISWTDINALVDSDFTKTEADGNFTITQGLKRANLGSSGLILRVDITSPTTGVQNMSYSLTDNIDTYITKTYQCATFDFDNTQGTGDSVYEYADCDTGTITQTTVFAGGVVTGQCARIVPTPSLVSGDGNPPALNPTIQCP